MEQESIAEMTTLNACHAFSSRSESERRSPSSFRFDGGAEQRGMMREHRYYVYMVISSSRRALYIGVTNNLEHRIAQHRSGELEGFTERYSVCRLVYYESYDDIRTAINREKQLKRWRREKKAWLIERVNPTYKDLSADWDKSVGKLAWATRHY